MGPTAAADGTARPDRASAKITSTRPAVATTSPIQWPRLILSVLHLARAGRSNITFASAPPMAPRICRAVCEHLALFARPAVCRRPSRSPRPRRAG